MGRGATVLTILLVGVPFAGALVYSLYEPLIVYKLTDSTRVRVEMFSAQIELYRQEKRRYPSTEEGLAKVVAEGYARELPEDAWHNKLHYRYPSNRKSVPFELWSLGADGKPGGIGDNADIGNWRE